MLKPNRTHIIDELPSLLFEMRQRIRKELPDGDKTDPNAWLRMETLQFIHQKNNPTMREVADYLHIRAPSATSLVSRLERERMVQRVKEKDDKRVVRLKLTEKGVHHVDRYCTTSRQLMRRTFSHLTDEELDDLARVLRRINKREL